MKKTFSFIICLVLISSLSINVFAMQLFVKTEENTMITLEVEPNDSIDFVKAKIQEITGIDSNHQILMFNGKEVENGKTLPEYNISKESILYLVINKPLDSDNPNGEITISAVISPTYTITIPETVELDSTATIKAENVLTEANKAVKVEITATNQTGNAFAVSTNDNSVISYQLKKANEVMKIGDSIVFEDDGNETLTFEKIATNQVFSGEYLGTVTFSISYETINN